MDECKQFNHEWEEVYYGLKCKVCGLFYPDNGNYFAPPDNDDTGWDICHRCGGEHGDGWSNCICDLEEE